MKRFSKRILSAVVGMLLSVVLVGCSSMQSAVFTLKSGSVVRVDYNPRYGYNLFYEDSTFYLGAKSKVPVITGYFTNDDSFRYFLSETEKDDDATILGVSGVSGEEFLTYSVSGSEDKLEYVHMFRLHDSDVYVALVTFESEAFLYSQKDCLGFSIE